MFASSLHARPASWDAGLDWIAIPRIRERRHAAEILRYAATLEMVLKAGALVSAASAQRESPLSLSDVYARYVPYVAKLGLRLLGRSDEVDDLIQDVFVIATERYPELRDQGALRGWLASITVRTAVRRLRRRRLKRLVFFAADERQPLDLDQFLTPGASSEHHQLLREVFSVLDEIPVKERIAWSLRVLEQEPLERVAELCDCSLATAKRRVQAAQHKLDEAMNR
jgi:RNA polymerase sigma-70 factor (ECF subfamily)